MHGFVFGSLFFIDFLFCELTMLEIFLYRKEKLTFMVFLLNIFCSLLTLGSGSNHALAIWQVKPDDFSTFVVWISYSIFAELKISTLNEFLESLLAVDVGNCLIIWGGWLEEVLTYSKLLIGFLYSLYVPLDRLKVISRNSMTLR